MLTFDAQNSECLVFTTKEGLLSPLAHDLKLKVTRFRVTLDTAARTLHGEFALDSLRVVCARQHDQDAPKLLSGRDHEKIERAIRDEVLDPTRYPRASLDAGYVMSGSQATVEGRLDLHGVTRPLRGQAVQQDGHWTLDVSLHQPDYRIRPYTAGFGTLRVAADVRVRVSLPLSLD